MGITFKGIHSSSIPAVWKTTKRPIMPTQKTSYENVMGADGSLDYSEFNSDGRVHYEDRIFEGTLTLLGSNLEHLQELLQKVVSWMTSGYGYLVFDDMPETYWFAKIEVIDTSEYEFFKVGRLNITFRARPFSTSARILLNSDIELDSDIMIGQADYRKENASSHVIHGEEDGHTHSKPTFYFTDFSPGEDIVIVLGDSVNGNKEFKFNTGDVDPVEGIFVDFDSYRLSIPLSKSNANFFEVPPGAYDLRIYGTSTFTLEVDYNYNYMYKAGEH